MSRSFTEPGGQRPAARAVFLAAFLAAGNAVQAAAPVVEGDSRNLVQRIDRIEQLLGSRGLLDLLNQIQALEQEVKRLRGEMEVQNHALEQLRDRQRDLYVDIDRRMQRLEGSAPPVAGFDQADGPPLENLSPMASTENFAAGEESEPLLTVELIGQQPTSPVPAEPAADRPAAAETATSDPILARTEYEQAFTLLKQSRYEQAIRSFRQFLASHPRSEQADSAQYWLGEAYYVTRDFEQAVVEYERLVAAYPESQKLTHALLKIGFSYQELGRIDEARQTLEDLRQRYPGTTAARLADERLKAIGSTASPTRVGN